MRPFKLQRRARVSRLLSRGVRRRRTRFTPSWRFPMSRFLAVLSLLAFRFAVSHAAPAPKGPPEKPYLPTTKGAVLVYQYMTNDDQGQPVQSEATNVVTAVAKTDAGTLITLSHSMEGSEYAGTDTFLISEKGRFTTGTNMTGSDIKGERSWRIEPPACLLRLPHKDGTKWEYNCPSQPGGLVGGRATNTAPRPGRGGGSG